MKLPLKIANIISFIFLSSFFTYQLLFFVSERFLFDKLFYKKSTSHGYSKCGPYTIHCDLEIDIQDRLSDLIRLVNRQTHKHKNNENIYKVVIIGDSMAYGLGIKENETFAKILEHKLNKKRDTVVINLSLPGDHIIDNFTKYQLAKRDIDANLYVFDMVDNDLYFDITNKYDEYYYQKFKKNCNLPEFSYKYTGVSKIETHPSKKSHSQYADILYYEITENPKYEF